MDHPPSGRSGRGGRFAPRDTPPRKRDGCRTGDVGGFDPDRGWVKGDIRLERPHSPAVPETRTHRRRWGSRCDLRRSRILRHLKGVPDRLGAVRWSRGGGSRAASIDRSDLGPVRHCLTGFGQTGSDTVLGCHQGVSPEGERKRDRMTHVLASVRWTRSPAPAPTYVGPCDRGKWVAKHSGNLYRPYRAGSVRIELDVPGVSNIPYNAASRGMPRGFDLRPIFPYGGGFGRAASVQCPLGRRSSDRRACSTDSLNSSALNRSRLVTSGHVPLLTHSIARMAAGTADRGATPMRSGDSRR